MSGRKCIVCYEQVPGHVGAVRVDKPGDGVVTSGIVICDRCLGQIIVNTLVTGQPWRPADAHTFCWLCGTTEHGDGGWIWIKVGHQERDVRVCTHCRRHMRRAARYSAGIPENWEDQPRLCVTCLNQRDDGKCHLEPIRATGEHLRGIHPECPKDGGCETGWRPKVVKRCD